MQLSKKLKALRKRRNLSVKDISLDLQIPESTYRGYEYGSKLPADLLPNLCRVLSVELEEFFKEENDEKVGGDEIWQTLIIMENCLKDIREYIKLTMPNP